MFKKGYTVKSSSLLRSSDRKALVNEVQERFRDAFANLADEDIRTTLELVVPKDIEVAPCSTYRGISGLLYTSDKKPLFLRFGESLIPSLHTLWLYPELLTAVLTPDVVLEHLQSGSDLMMKGMYEYSRGVRRGDAVAIRTPARPYVIAVGTALLDFAQIAQENGGKGVSLVSCLGDQLHDGKLVPVHTMPRPYDESKLECSGDTDSTSNITQETMPETPELSVPEIDRIFSDALLYGLYDTVSESKEASLMLPMSASTLIDSYVLPFLPLRHENLVLKKTSFKKASKFIAKQPILTSKEKGGQVFVTSIDWSSIQLREFVPYRIPKQDLNIVNNGKAKEANIKAMEITEYFKLPSKGRGLFSERDQTYYTRSELRSCLDVYIEAHSLVSPNPRLIRLDAPLYHILAKDSSEEFLPRETLIKNLVSVCIAHYSINGSNPKKGDAPRIKVNVEIRAGRKTITKVSNFEDFQLDPVALSEELRKKCAGATSLGEVKGTKPGTTIEVTIQGSQVKSVAEVLAIHGIKTSWLIVADKTKK